MSTSGPTRGAGKRPRRAYHHGDLRQALIRATLELIPVTGVRQLSLREVARRAGVSHAASYRHFQDKESLLAAVAEQGFRELADTMRGAVLAHPADPLAKLQAAGVAYVEFGIRNPHQLHVMFGGAIADFEEHPALKLAARMAHDELRAVVAEVLRSKAVGTPDEATVEASAWAIVHGLAVLLADGQIRTPDGTALSQRAQLTLANGVTALFCRGLAQS